MKLDQYLKWKGWVFTGGEAKQRIQGGDVRVNGAVETRRGRQLTEGDRVVLERGRIVELGTHQELMDARGRYRDLCERQVIRGVEFS